MAKELLESKGYVVCHWRDFKFEYTEEDMRNCFQQAQQWSSIISPHVIAMKYATFEGYKLALLSNDKSVFDIDQINARIKELSDKEYGRNEMYECWMAAIKYVQNNQYNPATLRPEYPQPFLDYCNSLNKK